MPMTLPAELEPTPTVALPFVAAADAALRRGPVAIAVCNVRRFRDITVAHGPEAGDQVLRTLAARLALRAAPNATVELLDGPRFGVLLPGIADPLLATEAVRSCLAVMAEPIAVDGHERRLAVTAGIAMGRAGDDGRACVLDADAALHHGRECGEAVCVFVEEQRLAAVARLEAAADVRRALAAGEIVLHYQPIVSLHDGSVVAVEALARWEHPLRGALGPEAFIGLAEESGSIAALGAALLDRACAQLAAWHRDPEIPPVDLHLNVSPLQLADPGFPDEVDRALRRAGAPAAHLVLEVTERVLMQRASSPAMVLERLRELGLRLVLDDFGTGGSALGAVKAFPVEAIKIDRAFVATAPDDPADYAVVQAITGLARALELRVIGEGVESEGQLTALRDLGVDAVQGYKLGRPAGAAATTRALRGDRPFTPIPAPAGAEELLSLGEAADALGVSAATLRRWGDAGRLRVVRTEGGHRRFSAAEVRRLRIGLAGRTPRARPLAPPSGPLPALSALLAEDGARLVATAAGAAHGDGVPGWFATAEARGVLANWLGAVAGAAAAGDPAAAGRATADLLRRATLGGAGLLERHVFLERVEGLTARALVERGAAHAEVTAARRLWRHLGHAHLASQET